MSERYLAIDAVCAWPNLTQLPDGTIVASIFNQPCHGRWEGDVECWASEDGRFWSRRGVPAPHEPGTNRMNVGAGLAANGDLLGTCYSSGKVWAIRSHDDGRTWPEHALIAEGRNETDLLHLEGDEWLAIARSAHGLGMGLYRSMDAGMTWTHDADVTLSNQHPGHLQRLGDGRILLSFGIRNVGLHGVGVRLSADGGRTWSNPRVLVQYDPHADGGYPASVQRADGTIVTAYYCSHTADHQRYHMGVVHWSPDEA